MKKFVFGLLALAPIFSSAQNENTEESTDIIINITKDGETSTITREYTGSLSEQDIKLLKMGAEEAQVILKEWSGTEGKEIIEAYFTDAAETDGATKAFMGVTGHNQQIGESEVVMLDRIIEDEGAAKAKLLPGDILLSADGKKLQSYLHLVKVIDTKQPGETISVQVKRGCDSFATEVLLGSKPAHTAAVFRNNKEGEVHMGLDIKEVKRLKQQIQNESEGGDMAARSYFNTKKQIENVDLEIFPNPTSGLFNFELKLEEGGKLSAEVFNASGLRVAEFTERSKNGFYKGEINLEDQPSGSYTLVFRQGEKMIIEKILKF